MDAGFELVISDEELQNLAALNRIKVIQMVAEAGTAHLASALSCVDILTVLYSSTLNIPSCEDLTRDRLILSKGHAAPALYAAMESVGLLTSKEIATFGLRDSYLEEHPSPFLKGVEAASGALGHGLPIGCGMAISSKIKNFGNHVFVVVGDGECNEGSVWEAATFASSNKLGNLCVIVDANGWQATCRSNEIMPIDTLRDRFSSFGWESHDVDGHDLNVLRRVLGEVKDRSKDSSPVCIVARTIKGKGVSYMEDDNNWHYKVPTGNDVSKARVELGVQ